MNAQIYPQLFDVPAMKMSRAWAMPNGKTFSIRPIGDLIRQVIGAYCGDKPIIDPFARDSKLAQITNDIDPLTGADRHTDALAFLQGFDSASVGGVLFDPPYSPRQVSECYRKLGMTVDMQTTQASFWAKLKAEIGRIVEPSGFVVTCGWNSGGIGQKHGFRIEHILLVAHGGWHNDTICTVERKG